LKKHRSPVKAAKQDIKRHKRNVSGKHAVATSVKKALAAVSAGDKAQALLELKSTQTIVDTACSKGILKPNTAGRRVSRIAKKIAAMA